jgi:hypothetical protein
MSKTKDDASQKYELSEVPEGLKDDLRKIIERKVKEKMEQEMEILYYDAAIAIELNRKKQYDKYFGNNQV